MNEISVFENESFGQVRTVMIDDVPWFVGKDVAVVLEYTNSRKALSDHVDDEDKGVTKCDTPGGVQDVVIINESGLYSLILSSKLPKAREFKRWVTSEVLPTLHRTGSYGGPAQQMSESETLEKAAAIMNREAERLRCVQQPSKYLPAADDGGVRFTLRTSILPHLELLTNEETGKLFLAILNYVESGETKIKLEGSTLMAFAFIRSEIESDLAKYMKRCQAARINGKKGGRPRKDATK